MLFYEQPQKFNAVLRDCVKELQVTLYKVDCFFECGEPGSKPAVRGYFTSAAMCGDCAIPSAQFALLMKGSG